MNVPSFLQEFVLSHNRPVLHRLCLPAGLSVGDALERVLRLPAVASKRYLTNKVSCPPPPEGVAQASL